MAFHGDAYSSFSHLEMPREEYNEQHREQMTGTLAVLRSGVEQLEWNLPAGAPRFFPAGSQHDAYVEIRNIIKNAVQEVAIIDPYVDSTLWTALKNLPAGVTIHPRAHETHAIRFRTRGEEVHNAAWQQSRDQKNELHSRPLYQDRSKAMLALGGLDQRRRS